MLLIARDAGQSPLWASLDCRDSSWAIRYMVVDTRNWWPGKKVLVSPEWIKGVDWSDSKVHVGVTREQIKKSPEYDPLDPVARDYEARLHNHYGRPSYWERRTP